MQLKENLLDNMRYKTKKIKKYAEGGSGYGVDYSYRDNTLNSNIANETQYNQQKNNYYTDLANQNYLNSTNKINNDYNTTIGNANAEVAASKQKNALFSKGINTSLSYKPSGQQNTYGQNLNAYFAEETGYLGMGVEEGSQIDPGGYIQENVIDPVKNTFTNKISDIPEEVGDVAGSNAFSTSSSKAVAGTSAAYNAAWKLNPEGISNGLNMSYPSHLYEKVGNEVVEKATGKVVEEVAKDVGTEVVKEVGQEVGEKAATEVTKTALKAPVAGGWWTLPVDIGLHYLSDDGDDSTYTAGEVATDIVSLGLDVVTLDFVGMATQLWDIGSQWSRRNKLKKVQKYAASNKRGEGVTADVERREDLKNAKKYVGYNQGSTGKASGYGRGELGGFSKYI